MNNDFLIVVVSILVVVLLFIIIIEQSRHRNKLIRKKLTKLITDVGGTAIEIKPVPIYGTQGVCHYAVYYVDKRGYIQEHRITHLIGFWGRLHGDILWDKPLDVVQHEPHSSKEQLISEMDAEIQRLRGALAATGSEDSMRYTK